MRFADHNGFAVSEVALNEIIRLIELKQEINELCQRLGEPPRHEMPSGGGGA